MKLKEQYNQSVKWFNAAIIRIESDSDLLPYKQLLLHEFIWYAIATVTKETLLIAIKMTKFNIEQEHGITLEDYLSHYDDIDINMVISGEFPESCYEEDNE